MSLWPGTAAAVDDEAEQRRGHDRRQEGADDPAPEAVRHEDGEVPDGDAHHHPDEQAHRPTSSRASSGPLALRLRLAGARGARDAGLGPTGRRSVAPRGGPSPAGAGSSAGRRLRARLGRRRGGPAGGVAGLAAGVGRSGARSGGSGRRPAAVRQGEPAAGGAASGGGGGPCGRRSAARRGGGAGAREAAPGAAPGCAARRGGPARRPAPGRRRSAAPPAGRPRRPARLGLCRARRSRTPAQPAVLLHDQPAPAHVDLLALLPLHQHRRRR